MLLEFFQSDYLFCIPINLAGVENIAGNFLISAPYFSYYETTDAYLNCFGLSLFIRSLQSVYPSVFFLVIILRLCHGKHVI